MSYKCDDIIELLKKCADGDKESIEFYNSVTWTEIYKEKDITHIIDLSNSGNLYASNLMSLAYITGNGVLYDYKQGIKLLKNANKGGVEIAFSNLVYFYTINKNYNKLIKLYNIEIEKGNISAISALANIYYENKDYTKAFELYTLAFNKGDKNANSKLANIYGVTKDYKKALELNIKVNKEKAKDNLINLFKLGNVKDIIKILSDPTYEEIIESDENLKINKKIITFYNKELLKTILLLKLPKDMINETLDKY